MASLLFTGLNAQASGTSSISFNNSYMTFNGYGHMNVTSAHALFSVNLTNGTSGNTTIYNVNAANMFEDGIIVIANPYIGIPPYSGSLTVQVANYTAPGTYDLIIAANGSDPSPNATLVLNVLPWKGNLATPSAFQPFQPAYVALYAVAIIIVLALISWTVLKRRPKAQQPPEQQVAM